MLIRYFARVVPTTLGTVEHEGVIKRMPLAETKYVVFSEHEVKKQATESLPETLRRWLVKCPQCAEVRLMVGARENERYVCKDCGHSFTVRHSVANDSIE